MKTGGNFVVLDLEPASWYMLRVTAHNSAGFTVAEYEFATLTINGGEPLDILIQIWVWVLSMEVDKIITLIPHLSLCFDMISIELLFISWFRLLYHTEIFYFRMMSILSFYQPNSYDIESWETKEQKHFPLVSLHILLWHRFCTHLSLKQPLFTWDDFDYDKNILSPRLFSLWILIYLIIMEWFFNLSMLSCMFLSNLTFQMT